MNMNGGTSTSATDPHHHLRGGGYMGLGPPGLGPAPMPPAGNGFGGSLGGMGMSGGMGPELKHHADFLSRLLAATPSYMSEVGNPPPGFFSDWLRRLVSKPGGESQRSPDMSNLTASAQHGPTGLEHQQQGSLTFPVTGQTESNGGSLHSPATQTTGGGKRRKRSRLNDHPLHLPEHHPSSGKESSTGRDASPASPHLNQNSLVSSALTSTISGSSPPSAGPASMNPFSHPLWFFPPFLPNPYMSTMGMGMNLPGLLPPHGVPPNSSTPPYLGPSLSGLPGGPDSLLSSFRTASDSILHHHQHHTFSSPTDLNLNNTKKEVEAKLPHKKPSKSSKKSSSFSISRLTSPSPSSNSSGGSVTVGRSSSAGTHPGETMRRTTASSPSSTGSRRKAEPGKSKKGNSDSGSETGSGGGHANKGSSSCGGSSNSSLCVDLRVSGRIWEKSGVAAPPPRSIYKPLSAFHDPSDVNLTHSSQPRSPDRLCLRLASSRSSTATEEQQKMIAGDQTSLSTTYVLKNLEHIYQRVRGRGASAETPINMGLPSALPRRKTEDTSPAPAANPQHPFNYSESEEISGHSSYLSHARSPLSSPPLERRKARPDLDIKIPLPRPIKLEASYTNGGARVSPPFISPASRSPSPDADEEGHGTGSDATVADLSVVDEDGRRSEDELHVHSDSTQNDYEATEPKQSPIGKEY